MNPAWLTLVAGIGIGTIVAALVSARMSKAVAIAGHRQAWINALRDHLSDYFHMIDRLEAARKRFDTGAPTAIAEARQTAKKGYRQILLRLNAGEKQHQVLERLLAGLLDEVDEVSIGVQSGPLIGAQKGPPGRLGAPLMSGASFALLAA
jgi:hypothetical protein